MMLTRLAASLCYNFILMFKIKDTSFEQIMGSMQFVPILGVNFQEIFPIILIFLFVFNLFNCCSKIMNCLGLNSVGFTSEFDEGKMKEGETLVK